MAAATTAPGIAGSTADSTPPDGGAEHRAERHLLGPEAHSPAHGAAPAATGTGAAPGNRPATQPAGAAMAPLVRMRCHSAGISSGRWRRRATASGAGRARPPRHRPEPRGVRPAVGRQRQAAEGADGAGEGQPDRVGFPFYRVGSHRRYHISDGGRQL